MVSRRELEGIIEDEINQIRMTELQLKQRFQSLKNGCGEAGFFEATNHFERPAEFGSQRSKPGWRLGGTRNQCKKNARHKFR